MFLSGRSDETWKGDLLPIWNNLHGNGFYENSRTLMALTLGERAKDQAKETDEEIKQTAIDSLNGMFADMIQVKYGRELVTSDIIDYQVTRWAEDPLFRGSYSVGFPFGYTTKDFDELTKPRGDGAWYPSGEFACAYHGGFTHGAYMQGKSTATQILIDHFGRNDLDARSLCSDLPEDLPDSYQPL